MDSIESLKDEGVLREYGNRDYIEDDDYYQDLISQIEVQEESEVSHSVE
jgi:hypothetical protein